MCNNCNCKNYDRCSIVGYFPPGFCCSNCYLYDESLTCLKSQFKTKAKEGTHKGLKKFTLKEASIEGDLIKVIIIQKGKEIPILIDLKKHLESV